MTDPTQTAKPRPRAAPEPGDTMSLFDPPPDPHELAAERRDEGMANALHASDVRWKATAEDIIARLAASGREFTIDDVTDQCGRALASSPNALGALMNSAARKRLIRKVGYRPSRSPSRQGGIVGTWVGTGEAA